MIDASSNGYASFRKALRSSVYTVRFRKQNISPAENFFAESKGKAAFGNMPDQNNYTSGGLDFQLSAPYSGIIRTSGQFHPRFDIFVPFSRSAALQILDFTQRIVYNK